VDRLTRFFEEFNEEFNNDFWNVASVPAYWRP
jgi:hypothetical protein